MGKGTIVGESGDGRYTVSLDFGTADIAQQVAEIDASISGLNASIADLQSDVLSAQADVRSLWESLNNAIAFYRVEPNDDTLQIINERAEAALKASQPLRRLEEQLGGLKLQRAQLQSRRGRLLAESVTQTQSAWCADYTEGATGDVAVIELNGEGPEVLIAPGARPPTASDGDMRDRLAMSGAAAWLNAALLPGWQKFKPTYRSGVLASIDRENNTGVVTLSSATSSAQDLDINQTPTVEAPFEYMTCNHVAFTVGDEVVVQFVNQDWGQPKIIGFVSNPKQCGVQRVIVPLRLISSSVQTYWPTALVARSLMEIDVDFLPCAGGQKRVPQTPPPLPPGYRVSGQAQNFAYNTHSLQTHISAGGVITSEDREGSNDTFVFNEDLRISGSPATINSTFPQDVLAGDFGTVLLGGYRIHRLNKFEVSGTALSDYEEDRLSFTLAQPDLPENEAVVTCQTLLVSQYINVPSSITLVPATGGPGQQLEFYRFYDINPNTFPDYPDFPTTLGGLALMFKAPGD